ncbi:HAD-IB family phosphatase [Mucilaginibacter polytrichastri]|uniref:phosphoserine phosphatase n=1 Tax=Mucilaginibacter polytrichastri TaxID=1302689 RepID=A0A1Q5ZS24_9SPHI|nr:HAD-IB family phosphatase [Mucilaginibacter polytrichastri]OKS84564.1 hypothetical protein RG47T_5254 [Mucilaginibacter polytrichastri]SFT24012.1 Haloacid Dehalogenase superfamily, subfamily IB, phosphoserine phosphatase-like [Mucilaginibacter polytrichastri]
MSTSSSKKRTKIFISHSALDKEIAQALVELLINGVGLDESLIFCSSVPGHDIPLGVNFNDYIISQLTGYDAQMISLISNSYYNSKYCLYEMGAAWGLCKTKIIPMLLYDMKHANLQDFIHFNQAIMSDDSDQINKLCDHFRDDSSFPRKPVVTNKYESERAKFLAISKKKIRPEPTSPKELIGKKKYDYKYKAVAFDFDGTILQGDNFVYSWKAIWQHLKYSDDVRTTLYKRHYQDSKNYTYQDWCDDCCKHFIAKGFNHKQVKEIFKAKHLKLAEGFELTVKLLKSFGLHIAIISGGVDSFIQEAIPDKTMQSIDEIFVNRFVYGSRGELVKIEAYPNAEADGTGKVRAMESFCAKYGLTPAEVVFVGEGLNDIDVATISGKPLSFPAAKAFDDYNDLDNVTPVYDDNMAGILSHILIPKSSS